MSPASRAPSAIIGRDSRTREPLCLGDIEHRSGLYILGKPGMGKSALMVNLAAQAIENGHGVFFLDPHGDAIEELVSRISAEETSLEALAEFFYLLTPENQSHSPGISLLACKDLTSLKERTDTYTRAYGVFYKLWQDSWGPWLQLILQNTLWAFVENQDYTLTEAPMFLNPRSIAFRNHILANVKHHHATVDFWKYEFFQRRARDQQERVDAALTRITTLLTHPYVRHIIGQKTTTIDFATMLQKQQIVLVKLSASLAPDIKKFIGTILISELLHAVRTRPEDAREQFCIFVDEFQNFASSDDFTTLITEARKFGIATTIAHQERFGQFADNQKLLGATSAAVNKVFFQLTVQDAQELAPEFAQSVEATKTRREAELVISPHAIEDLWEKGHPSPSIMAIREKYFWIVELLRSKPNERYYVFDLSRAKTTEGNGGTLQWHAFADWDMYRSSPDMVREGLALLNHYYSERMIKKPLTANGYKERPKSDKDMELIFRVIELLGGVFGWRPTMEPYIPQDTAALFVRRLNEQSEQRHREFVNEIQMQHRAIAHDAERWQRNNPYHAWNAQPPQGYPISAHELLKIIAENKPKEWYLYHIPDAVAVEDIQKLRNSAITLGFTQAELEHLVEWRIRPLHPLERKPLAEVITIVANIKADTAAYEREQQRVYLDYTSVMSVRPMVARFGEDHSSLPFQKTKPYLKTVVERNVWQSSELQHFIMMAFLACPAALEREPVKIPSSKYDESLTVERTQQDLINERAQELANLPRFTAFAKIIQEEGGQQTVIKRKIETRPLPLLPEKPLTDAKSNTPSTIIELNTIRAGVYRPRQLIEKELRERRDKWLRRQGSLTPPPTSEPPPPASA